MRSSALIIASWLLLVSACQKIGQHKKFPDPGLIPGLATPFKFEGSQSVLLLADFFPDPFVVDSVKGHEAFTIKHHPETGEVVVTARNNQVPHYSELKVWAKGFKYSLLLEKSQKLNFTHTFDPQGKVYKEAFLFGQMNNWNRNATPLVFSDGKWHAAFELNPGKYQYLLLLDGNEVLDPHNPDSIDNNIGGFNSVMTVGNIYKENIPVLIPAKAQDDGLVIRFENNPEKIFAFWQNHRLPVDFVIRKSNKIIISIPEIASKMDRSFIRIWSYNKSGVSNDLLIPLHQGNLLIDPLYLTREDVEASVLYFIMVDRFNNGNPANDDPVKDPDVLPPANYWGGDLAGVTQKIRDGYFDDLGINAIWFSPITQNPLDAYVEFPEPRRKYTGYHGYWPITLTTVDHRFGTSQELRELVAAAHEGGMNVLLDYVSNHVHEENMLIKENPHWATELDLPGGRKNIRLWDEQRLTTWFDTFLPSLDFSQPEVIETMADSAVFWIKEYNIDGFRHDATKHIPLHFWRTLTRKLKEEVIVPQNRRLYQIGETFGSRELIGNYVGSGLLDGQFDFNLYFDARSIFALDSESFVRMNQSLKETFAYYGTNHLMGNITGNHDLPRFISFAGGALRFDEDSAEAGWSRNIQVDDTVGYDKLSMLTAFIMTIPGVPVVYYGDEIGMPGGGDPDSRRPMRFENLNEHEIRTREIASQLGRLRQNRLSLIYGDFTVLHVDDETWIYSRRYFDEITIVAFNKSNQPKSIVFNVPQAFENAALKTNFRSTLNKQEEGFIITLKPYSFDVLIN
jgi:cyclomaltodextrinase / maltogenic alpha-amylase / neopullulanase